jgi:hypothetical protein
MGTLKKVVFVLLAVLSLAGNAAYAINIQSVNDGPWTDANVWNPRQVPGPGDDVTITADTNVWQEAPGPAISVASLTVEPNAALLGTELVDPDGTVYAGMIHVTAHQITNQGLIRARGGHRRGGLVKLVLAPTPSYVLHIGALTIEIPEPAVFENFGVVEANDTNDALKLGNAHRTYGGFLWIVTDQLHPFSVNFDGKGGCNDDLWIYPVILNHADAVIAGGKAREVGGMVTMEASTFTNDGVVVAGDNNFPPEHIAGLGGNVNISVQAARVDLYDEWNAYTGSVFLGNPGVAFVNTGDILAGHDTSNTPSPVIIGIGGSVFASCRGELTNSGIIRSGNGETGGWVICDSYIWPWANTETGQIIGGDNRDLSVEGGGIVLAHGTPKVNRGVIRAGNAGEVFDPMLQELSNNAEIWGENVRLAGDSNSMEIDLNSLTHQPAIQAANDLEIILPPGGVLEIQGCPNDTNGPPYLASAGGNIVLRADYIHIGCGLDMNDLFSPMPTVEYGSRFADVHIGPGGAVIGEPCEESTFRVNVTNVGTKTSQVSWQISSDNGWLTSPQQDSNTLGPGESKEFMVSYWIPGAVGLSECEVVSLHTEVNEPCEPFVEHDNKLFIFSSRYSKIVSLGEFAATWLSIPDEPSWNGYYDFNGDFIVDFKDFFEFATWWLWYDEMGP